MALSPQLPPYDPIHASLIFKEDVSPTPYDRTSFNVI